ncbi:MAG: MlaA family lipoprotein [Syntrophales bacterium]
MMIIIRRAYPLILVLCWFLLLAGCATTAANRPPEIPAMHSASEIDDERIAHIDDPWEGFNRSMYKFNYYFDKYFFLPVVRGYEFILPTFAQTGVSNFFSNIREVRTFYNSLLQLKGEKAVMTLGRFVTNSIIGIGGLFDPATSFGMVMQNEDFGQTLAVWGVGTGPYLVLPVLGPNTARSTGGLVVDAGVRYAIVSAIDPFKNVNEAWAIETGIETLEAIDMRHREKFRYYESGYPFEYDIVRFLYVKKRELLSLK